MASLTIEPPQPFIDSRPDLAKVGRLRQRMEEEGYLYVKGLLHPDKVRSLRKDILQICEEFNCLDPNTPLMEGKTPQGSTSLVGGHGSQPYDAIYLRTQKLESFHTLPHDPNLLELIEKIVEGEPLVHPRNILRILPPSSSRITTPPHQDFWYIGGSERTYTSWIPLGDCKGDLGGLQLLPGSHKKGLLERQPREGAGGFGVATELPTSGWVSQNMECGDILLFHSFLVHQGMDNSTHNRLRLSADFRFQSVEEPISPSSLSAHYGIKWNIIYEDWPKHSRRRYYWKNLNLKLD